MKTWTKNQKAALDAVLADAPACIRAIDRALLAHCEATGTDPAAHDGRAALASLRATLAAFAAATKPEHVRDLLL